MTDFFRFPHTPHLAWLSDTPLRQDKLLSMTEIESLLAGEVVIEEKLDGANLGFSTDQNGRLCIQNRGQYLSRPFTGQFKKLESWLAPRAEDLASIAGDGLIIFGEWCAARHSIFYNELPDWFLLFDVYDKQAGKFWSTMRRNELAQLLDLSIVPALHKGKISLDELLSRFLNKRSQFSAGYLEGIVVRRETDDWLTQRAKIVRPDFTQNINQHWSKQKIKWNHLTGSKDKTVNS